jgi:hypothetical protein
MDNPRPESRPGPDAQRTIAASGMPRWVKVFIAVGLALIVLMVVAMLLTGGRHGPGRHLSPPPQGGTAATTPATTSAAVEGGH